MATKSATDLSARHSAYCSGHGAKASWMAERLSRWRRAFRTSGWHHKTATVCQHFLTTYFYDVARQCGSHLACHLFYQYLVNTIMDNLFLLLFFVSFIALVVGVIRPSVITRLTKLKLSRGKIALVFGGAMLTTMILFGMTTDTTTNTNTRNNNTSAQVSNVNTTTSNVNAVVVTNTPSNTNTTVTTPKNTNSAAPTNTDTSASRQQAIVSAIEKAIGVKTNMGKSSVRLVKVLADASSVRIELNGSENFTNKLTLQGINSDTLKAYEATFATDKTPNLYVAIDMYFPGTDIYGNTTDSLAVQSKLTRATANKIQWDNITSDNIPRVFDYYNQVMNFN